MPELLKMLASYVPSMIVRRVLIDPSPLSAPVEDHFQSALLFADLSGFTSLAEHLAQQGPRGAEDLNHFLNSTFDQLITLITALGGDVVTFAGDALLAIWPAYHDELSLMTHRAAQCSLALQELLQIEREATAFHLDIRIGIGVGNVAMAHLGGVYERWVWLITGSSVLRVMQGEQLAQPGQVVLSPEAWELVRGQCAGRPADGGLSLVPDAPPVMVLEEVHEPAPVYLFQPSELVPEMESALRTYIPDVVLIRLAAGQGNWLAELRMITVLFINLPDMYDAGTTLDQMQVALCTLQHALYRYEGSVNKLSVDEKGAVLIAVFGLPPLAHEDDAVRGVQAALAVRDNLRQIGFRSAIGVTTGRAFCGIVGNERRREYTILGDIVNLAARLMQAAAAGSSLPAGSSRSSPHAFNRILCDGSTFQAAQQRLVFQELEPLVVKGKAEPVSVFCPHGETHHMIYPQDTLIGRSQEQSLLAAHLQSLRRKDVARRVHGEASVVFLEGEAGAGKTRLVQDLCQHAETLGILTLVGAGDAVEQTTPYHAWRNVFARAFGLEPTADTVQRRQQVLDRLASEPDMVCQASLLNTVLPLDLPAHAAVAYLSGHALAEATRTFLVDVVQLLMGNAPVLLVLEDAHWFDSASWSLVLLVCQRISPLFFVVTGRPIPDPQPEAYHRLIQWPTMHQMKLEPLSPEDTYALVCQRLGVTRAPEAVTHLIHEKSQGNPFFIEELTYALHDAGEIVITDGVCWVSPEAGDVQLLGLPDTAQGVITSRIDGLSPEQQLLLKVASVIGFSFPVNILCGVYPVEKQDLDMLLAALEHLGLIQRESYEAEPAYRFKNAIVQEVVYQLMPFAQRRQLHCAVAEWYESAYAEHLEEYAALLAQHFAHADDPRAQHYYTLAGDEALRLYATAEAAEHFRCALEVARRSQASSERCRYLYRQYGRILEMQAEYQLALATYEEMATLADERDDPEIKLVALMALATLQSTPNPTFAPLQAEHLLEQALVLARTLEQTAAETRILWNLMLLKIYTGDDDNQAVSYGEQSLALARSAGLLEQMALTLNDLATVYRGNGQIGRSQLVLEEANRIWRNLGNLPMLSDTLARSSYTSFLAGNYDQAIGSSNEAAQISESIGNLAGQANSRLLIGHVYLDRGQPGRAIELMGEAIFQGEQVGQLAVQIGTRADLGWVYGLLGEVEYGIVLAEVACTRSEEHNNILRPWAMAVLARLSLLKGDLAAAEQAVEKSYETFKGSRDILLVPIYVPLAEAELALASRRYEQGISMLNRLLAYLEENRFRPFVADVLYLKSRAVLSLGQVETAYTLLHMARNEAEKTGSRRMLWPIVEHLSLLEARMGHFTEAAQLRKQARDIISAIAHNAGSSELQHAFLSQPHVRALVGKYILQL